MSVEVIIDLQQEARRLFIAGSAMAPGDLRLTKRLPQLQKLGEAAPVFKRLAESVEVLLSSAREDSAARLLELGTLLSAVLHTQGKTDTPGQSHLIEGDGIALSTDVAFRKLQPLLNALTTKGQGRMELLRSAFEDRSFMDLRVLPVACSALDDSYSEIPTFIQQKLIPAFGGNALPVLRSQLDLQGGKGAARRLQLLHYLAPETFLDLVLEAASTGSVEVKVTAIELLGEYPEQEQFLLDQSLERRKEVRQAAFLALAGLGTVGAADRLYEAVTSKDRELAVEPVRRCTSDVLLKRIIAHAEHELPRYLANEGAARSEALDQLRIDLSCLEGSGSQAADAAFPLLRKLLTTDAFIVPESEALQEAAAELLLALDRPEADHFMIDLQHAYKGKFIGFSFRAAYKRLTPSEVYNRFAGQVAGRSAVAKSLRSAISLVVSRYLQGEEARSNEVVPEKMWDPRWVDAFIQADAVELVCAFTHRADKGVMSYLKSKLAGGTGNKDVQSVDILLAMYRVHYEEAPELLMSMLERTQLRSYYYVDPQLKRMLAAMPSSYAPRLREFGLKVSYDSLRNEFLEIAGALEAATEENDEERGTGLWGWIRNKMS